MVKRSRVRSSLRSPMAASSRRTCAETRLSSTTSRRCSIPDSPAPPQRGHADGAAPPGPGALRSAANPQVGQNAIGPDRRVVGAEVDGVDEDLQAPRVERRARRELAQRVRRRAREAVRLRVELLGLRVDPGHRHVERDDVVEQRVVGQDPELLQDRDPVLARKPLRLVPGHRERGARGPQRRAGRRRSRPGSRPWCSSSGSAASMAARRCASPSTAAAQRCDASYRCAARPLRARLTVSWGRPAAQVLRSGPGQAVEARRGTGPGDRRAPSSAKPDQLPEEASPRRPTRARPGPCAGAAGSPRGRSGRRGGRRTAAAGSPRRAGRSRAGGPAPLMTDSGSPSRGSCSPRPVTKARLSALPVRRPARPTRCR